MSRISFKEMQTTIKQAFVKAGLSEEKADICAHVHAGSSRDGVYSHGLNRVARFVEYIQKGWVNADAEPTLEKRLTAIEIYNGNLGPGVLNAQFAMNRAMELAENHGLGMVGLNNTTHWMRGGTYGRQAAEKGFVALCWTNTESCMPAWGAKSVGIGNNPFILAVPREKGHLVLDMAMSQYSYGKLQVTRLKNEKLPYPGGFDENGYLSNEPGAIEQTKRILPTGFWKGSGMAILLDILSAILSNGLSTAGIDRAGKGSCGRCNQVFIAFDPVKITGKQFMDKVVEETIAQIKSSQPADENTNIFYPGEQSLKIRNENLRLGIPVDKGIWEEVKKLASE